MNKFIFVVLGAAFCAMPAAANDSDMTQIASGKTKAVMAHGICRQITNNNASPVMIPHKTASEWSVGANSFLAGDRPGLTVQFCPPTQSTIFNCPNPYDYMNCGNAVSKGIHISSDGRYVFVFENGYSGSYGTPKIHIYSMENGVPDLVRTVILKNSYPIPDSSFAINGDGSLFAVWNRRYSDNSDYIPVVSFYSFDGATEKFLFEEQPSFGAQSGGAYYEFAMSSDGKTLMISENLIDFTGSSISKSPVTADFSVEGVPVWSDALNGFVQIAAGPNSSIWLATKNNNGKWKNRKIFSYEEIGITMSLSRLALSFDGSKAAIIRISDSKSEGPSLDFFSIENGSFVLKKTMTFENWISNRRDIYPGIEFSSDGLKLLMRKDTEISVFDVSRIADGIVVSKPGFTLDPLLGSQFAVWMTAAKNGYIAYASPDAGGHIGRVGIMPSP
ncbi:hypothetical protein [Rhodovulum viride]|uniref:hypothetical protein n=1 Tax=Rhodovulum viride TaxID=1231134 RepID=UPI0011BE617B|nr:hypothetical protein [Rhodovulum viride]